MLPAGYKLTDFNQKRRTMVYVNNGDELDFLDEWDPRQLRQRLQPYPPDLWFGFTELYMDKNQPIFKPKFRIGSTTSPSAIQDKEKLQREQ